MRDQNEQGMKKNNAKHGTTREQDQELGQNEKVRDQEDQYATAGGQMTRDKGQVPHRDDDPTQDQLGENR